MVTLRKDPRIPEPWLPGTNQPAEPSPGASPTKRLETKAERAVSCGTPPAPPRVDLTTIAQHKPPTTPRERPFTNTATNRPPTPSFIRPSSFVHLTGPGRQFRDVALSPGTRLTPWSGGGPGRLTGASAPHDCRACGPVPTLYSPCGMVQNDFVTPCLVGPYFRSGSPWAPTVQTFRYLGHCIFSFYLPHARIGLSRLRRGPRWVSSGPRGQQRFRGGRDRPVQRSGNWPGPLGINQTHRRAHTADKAIREGGRV